MDELELARKAVARQLLSEDQLRDAQLYAQGGRSLISVLLDLGYLRTEDLPGLVGLVRRAPRPWPARRTIVVGAVVLAALGLAFSSRQASKSSSAPFAPALRAAEPYHPAFYDFPAELAREGQRGVAEVERQLKSEKSLTAELEAGLRHAQAFLEEAIQRKTADGDTLYALGRARELLDQWESASEAYQQALRTSPDHLYSLLGQARVLLNLQRFSEAYPRADRACALLGTGECFLVRGKIRIALGNPELGQVDLLESRRRDPNLGSEVAKILGRLGE